MVAQVLGEVGQQLITDTTETVPLGSKLILSNGDQYRFVHVASGAAVAKVTPLNQGVVGASPFATDESPTVAAAINTFTVQCDVAGAGATQDILKGGTLIDETNSHVYEIKSNTTATNAAPELDVFITIAGGSGFITDLAVGDVVRFYQSTYNNILIKPATPSTSMLVGFTEAIIAADQYGWVKTRGWTPVLVDASVALVVGDVCMSSIDDAGAVGTEATTEQVCGVVYNAGTNLNVDGEIFITMD